MKVKIWGTRGSFPMAAGEYQEYGGNTSCVSADSGGYTVIFDAGSGLAALGASLEGTGGRQRYDIFLSHMHMDHVMGLFGFPQLYDREAEVHLYGEARGDRSFRGQLETLLGPPYWPTALKEFPASLYFHEVGPGEELSLPGQIQIRTFRGKHPGGSILYRMDAEEKSIFYGLDCEMDDSIFDALAEFTGGCAMLICDAQFTSEEYPLRAGWGHSTWRRGIKLRRAAGAGKALMTHYAWNHTDEMLRRQEQLALTEDQNVFFAKEGMEVFL